MKEDHNWLLLIRQQLDVGEASGIINGQVSNLITITAGASLRAGSLSATHHALRGLFLDADLDQDTGPFQLIGLHLVIGLQAASGARDPGGLESCQRWIKAHAAAVRCAGGAGNWCLKSTASGRWCGIIVHQRMRQALPGCTKEAGLRDW